MHYIGIILAVFLLAGVLFCVRYLVQSKGAWVIVTLDGREISRYSSMADGIYRIEGRGKDYNVLVIEDGKASIKEANCQNQFCVHTKAISYKGETITCIPHKIQITVEGGSNSEYDAITN